MIKILDQYVSRFAACYHADTIEGHAGLPDNSIDLSVFSPPFESLYCYSASDRDAGNSHGREQFAEHLGFLAREQFRTVKPGRIVAIHCMELPTTIQHHGYIGFIDFPARMREIYEAAGFVMHCPYVTIWKDPEVQANRTYARQLTWGEMVKDSSMSGCGTPDRILIMRKPGDSEVPIVHLNDEQFAALRWVAGHREAEPPRRGLVDDLMRLSVLTRVALETPEAFAAWLGTADMKSLTPLGATVLAGRLGTDHLAERDDAGKPRHWQRWASPVWSMTYDPEQDAWVALDADKPIEIGTDALMRGLRHAINCGAVERAKLLAGVLAERASVASYSGQPFPDFVWASANGIWFDGFVDYESPRAGNPDKRGIDQGDTLNFRAAREHQDERHVCPLQVGVVDRLIDLYTNPGDVVLTPFMGIGTEVVCAVKKGRRGVGFELKGSYFRQAVEHVKRVEPGAKGQQLGLLDLLGEGKASYETGPMIQRRVIASPDGPDIWIDAKPPVMGQCGTCDSEGPIGECEACGGEIK